MHRSQYDHDRSSLDYRKKRQYGLNVDQDTSLPTVDQQQLSPKGFQLAFSPIQKSSYSSVKQQSRVLPSDNSEQQPQIPRETVSQTLPGRMLFSNPSLSFN